MIARRSSCLAIAAVWTIGVSLTAFQTSKSATAAKQLAQALEAAKLDSIAAPDPADPSTFVAALYIPGSQLLVISAKYAAPSLLTGKIKSKEYRDVYIDLSSAAVAGTKVFIIDQNCDGLASKPGDNGVADSWEGGKQQLSFDGEWKKAKMTEQDYMKAFTNADELYAKIVALLTAQAKQAPGSFLP
jgi:hypothetical protein